MKKKCALIRRWMKSSHWFYGKVTSDSENNESWCFLASSDYSDYITMKLRKKIFQITFSGVLGYADNKIHFFEAVFQEKQAKFFD